MSRTTFRIHKTIRLFALIGFATLAFSLSARAQPEPTVISLGSFVENTSTSHCCMATFETSQYTVPQGKRLVLEQVFFQIDTSAAANARGVVEVLTSTLYGSSYQRYPLQLTKQGLSWEGRAIYGTSQVMKLYISNPAGKTVKVRFVAYVNDLGYSSGSSNSISGYLETLPQ